MKRLTIIALTAFSFMSCGDNSQTNSSEEDTTTNAVINATGEETNPYNLPGSDTGAIHQNTSEPGVLDMDARDSGQHQ